MNDATVLIKFKGDTKDINGKLTGLNKSMGNLTKSFVAGNLISKGVTAAFRMISNSAGDAVKRLDTMNNFPKVMSNLGISAKDSQKAINTLSEKLKGLPTSLDSAAMAVQRLTSKNGDIKKSTNLFLAMNNAILAGGAPAELQAQAIEQLTQAYAKGKPDMMEWRSLMNAMPAQLKQVATAMGYANPDALGKDLREGNVSMDKFMDTIEKLNTKGVKGFQSFEQQARNSTGGIQTAITNMKTAITRGLANAFDALDKALKSGGLGGISEVISNIGKGFESALKAIIPVIPPIIKAITSLFNWMKKHETLSKILIGTIAGLAIGFKLFGVAMNIVGTVSRVVNVISKLGPIFKGLLTVIKLVGTAFKALGIAMMANPIGIVIAIIAALVAIFVVLWKKCAWFRDFWKGLWEGIKNVFSNVWNALKGAFNAVVNWIKTNWKSILLFLINPFAGAFKYLYDHCEKFRNFVDNFVNKVVGFFKAIPGFIASLPGRIWNIFKQILVFLASIPGKIWGFLQKIPYYIGYIIGYIIGLHVKFWQRVWQFITVDIPNFINTIINWIKQLPGKIWTWLQQVHIKVGLWVHNMVQKAKEMGSKFVSNVVNFIKSLPGKVWTWISNTYQKVSTWVSNMTTKAKEMGSKFINNIINFVKSLPTRIWNFLKSAISKVANFGSQMASKAKSAGKSLFNGIVNNIKSLPSRLLNIGKNAAKAVWNGIRSVKDWVISKIKGFGKGIIDGMKAALGIHSPSKEFMILGKFSVLGYTEALDKMQKDVQRQINSTFSLSPNVTGSMNNHFSPNVNITNNVDVSTDPLGQTVNKIKTFAGGAKNDYNYGLGA